MWDSDEYPPIYLSEKEVLKYLNWDTLVPCIENVLSDISHKEETQSIQPARLITPIPHKQAALLCMPSFSGKQNVLGCKIVTSFRKNRAEGLPSIFGTVLLMDPDTGKVKMIAEGSEITGWRTAAASVVATKYLHQGEKNVLAILGASVQGKSHAEALQHFFNFKEVRIWNRTFDRADALCHDLGPWARAYESNETCVRGADVVVTVTNSLQPIVQADWLKPGVHINAVGFGSRHYDELSMDVYRQATVIVDNMAGAKQELQGLEDSGVPLRCELGEFIRNVRTMPTDKPTTVFHSLGMSLEDVATAELIYQRCRANQPSQQRRRLTCDEPGKSSG